jgi:hypothetical protein
MPVTLPATSLRNFMPSSTPPEEEMVGSFTFCRPEEGAVVPKMVCEGIAPGTKVTSTQ